MLLCHRLERPHRDRDAYAAAHLPYLVPLLGVALEAAFLGNERAHQTHMAHPVQHLNGTGFVLALLEVPQRLTLPAVGSVGGSDRVQAGDMALHPLKLRCQLMDLARHIGRVDECKSHLFSRSGAWRRGGRDLNRTLGHLLEIGVRRRLLGDGHVDAAVLGVPASIDDVLFVSGTGCGAGHFQHLLSLLAQVIDE